MTREELIRQARTAASTPVTGSYEYEQLQMWIYALCDELEKCP